MSLFFETEVHVTSSDEEPIGKRMKPSTDVALRKSNDFIVMHVNLPLSPSMFEGMEVQTLEFAQEGYETNFFKSHVVFKEKYTVSEVSRLIETPVKQLGVACSINKGIFSHEEQFDVLPVKIFLNQARNLHEKGELYSSYRCWVKDGKPIDAEAFAEDMLQKLELGHTTVLDSDFVGRDSKKIRGFVYALAHPMLRGRCVVVVLCMCVIYV